MNELPSQKSPLHENASLLETITGHSPVVILTVREYNELVAKAEQNEEAQCLLGILRDLSGLSDQMKMMINKAIDKQIFVHKKTQ